MSLRRTRRRKISMRGNRKLSAKATTFVWLALSGLPAFAQATNYQYTGHPFVFFSCGGSSECTTPGPNANTSYSASNFVTATMTLAAPLAANLSLQDATTLPGFQLTMNDGQQTVTAPLPGSGVVALVSTDASGNIVEPWAVFINTGGFDNGGVAALNYPGGNGVGDEGVLECCYPPSAGNVGQNNLASIFGAPGTWTTNAPTLLSYGTFTRANEFSFADNSDLIMGGIGKSKTVGGAGSEYGANYALANFEPITLYPSTVTVND